MALVKSATFQGVRPKDADVDALIVAEAVANTVGDLQLVKDKLTGEHGETGTIIHDGTAGRGSLLGYTLCSQDFQGVRLGATEAKGAGQTYIWAAPVFFPPGEAVVHIDFKIAFDRYRPVFVHIFDDTWADTIEVVPMEVVDDPHSHEDTSANYILRYIYARGSAPSGEVLFVTLETETFLGASDSGDDATDNSTMEWLSIYCPRTPNEGGGSPDSLVYGSNPYAVATPSAGVAWNASEWYDEEVAGLAPLAAEVLANANRDINGVQEYLPGARLPGNWSRQLADSGSTNPTTSRAFAHTRSVHAAEPLIKMPLHVQCFGAIAYDGDWVVNVGALDGLENFYAPFGNATAADGTERTLWKHSAYLPDFPTASVNAFKLVLLIASFNGDVTNWLFRMEGDPVAGQAPTQLGSSNFWVVEIDDISLSVDAATTLDLTAENTNGAQIATREMALVGACLYFDG